MTQSINYNKIYVVGRLSLPVECCIILTVKKRKLATLPHTSPQNGVVDTLKGFDSKTNDSVKEQFSIGSQKMLAVKYDSDMKKNHKTAKKLDKE